MSRFGLILILCITQPAYAQQVEVLSDSTKTDGDTVVIMRRGKVITAEQYAARYVPRKALLFSAVLPGMGQVYNKKYWKVPLVYGGFYLITAVAFGYNDLYNEYKTELFSKIRDPAYQAKYSYTEAQLRSVTEFYRRQRDFFLVLDGLWYLLQLVDAHVDAHLREFDLNPQLKVSVGPAIQSGPFYGQVTGMALTIKF